MKFSDALAAWRGWDHESVVSCLAFADYCEDRGLDVYYTGNWRKFCPFYGAGHITSELVRLSRAEAAEAEREARRAAKRRP